MEKKKRGLIIALFLGIFIINFASAFTINEDIPTSVQLKCGESYNREFVISPDGSENITVTPGIITNSNMNLALTFHPITNHLYISFFQNGACIVDDKHFSFSINDQDYPIYVNITEDLFDLENITLKEGEKITVGSNIEFSLLTAGNGNILYAIDGCDISIDDFLNVGSYKEVVCDDEIVRFTILDSYIDLDASRMLVSSSESGWNIIKGESSVVSDDDCELGLDTLGAKIKRGNIFAITTLNIVDNKKVDGVSVTILDQTGELSPINGISSNTGFFSERLHENYAENIIVQLEKEGCEPNTQVKLFETTYNDFIDNKNKEKNSMTLNFSLKDNYKSGEDFSSKVLNLLGEEIENAEVKITSPSDTSSTIKTDFDGSFNFSLAEPGIWKIQVGKTDYQSSDLIEFEVISSEFIIIAFVDGEVVSRFQKGDEIVLEMRDENDTIVKRTLTATIGSESIEFIDGISEEIIFNDRIELLIPEGDGYNKYDMTLRVEESDVKLWHVLTGIGFLVLVVVLISLFSKKGPAAIKQKDGIGELKFQSN